MKIFLLLLILFSFLQSAFLSVNFCLVLIISRALLVDDEKNLWLAFLGGLLLSFLTQTNLGYWPLVFLLIVKLAQVLKKLPVSPNPLTVFLGGSILVSVVFLLNAFFLKEKTTLTPYIIEAVLVVPVFYLIQLWEERFVVKRDIKLRV